MKKNRSKNQPVDIHVPSETVVGAADILNDPQTLISLLNLHTYASLVLDEDSIVIFASHCAASILGRESESIIGRPIAELIPCWDQGENEANSHLGEPRESVDESAPLSFEIKRQNVGSFTIVVLRDLTEINHLKTENLNLQTELREIEASIMLSQELLRNNNFDLIRSIAELNELNVELDEANRVKADFIANTSHEFRTPLNSIIGFMQMIIENIYENEEERDEYIRGTLDSAHHLLHLINEVLDIAKVDSGSLEVAKDRIDIQELFQELNSVVRSKYPDKGLDISFEVEKNIVPVVYADYDKLKQILFGLFSNAIKFTDEGSIRVSVGPYPDDQDNFVFSIEDTGRGIPEKYHKWVFEKFFQVDGSSTRKHDGTGLGLSFAKSLVELMGGMIWIVKRGKKKGTKVSFTLPAATEENTKNIECSKEIRTIETLLPNTF